MKICQCQWLPDQLGARYIIASTSAWQRWTTLIRIWEYMELHSDNWVKDSSDNQRPASCLFEEVDSILFTRNTMNRQHHHQHHRHHIHDNGHQDHNPDLHVKDIHEVARRRGVAACDQSLNFTHLQLHVAPKSKPSLAFFNPSLIKLNFPSLELVKSYLRLLIFELNFKL